MSEATILCESKSVEWRIKNFFELMDRAYMIKTSCFYLCGSKWHLSILPDTILGCYRSKKIELYLRRNNSTVEHHVVCRFGVKTIIGTEFEAVDIDCTFKKGEVRSKEIKRIDGSKLIRSKNEVAPDGTLTVFCNLKINRPFTSSTVESATQTPADGSLAFIEDLKNLFFSSRHADVTITVKNKEFRAHRSILSSRSSVFECMFMHDMKEKKSGSVKIPDCDPDTFKEFLLFLYTGKFDYVSCNNAVSLYRIADKYDVKELRDECVRCMVDELSDDIFCDVFHLATIQNEKELLKAVTEYFINNAKSIILTKKWKTFFEENPTLENELYFKVYSTIGKPLFIDFFSKNTIK